MNVFFRTDIVARSAYTIIRHREALCQVTHGGGKLRIRAAILSHNGFFHAGIGGRACNGVLMFLVIGPQRRSPLFPRPFRANVAAGFRGRMPEILQRAVLLLILGDELLQHFAIAQIIGARRFVLRVCVKIQIQLNAYELVFADLVQQSTLRCFHVHSLLRP